MSFLNAWSWPAAVANRPETQSYVRTALRASEAPGTEQLTERPCTVKPSSGSPLRGSSKQQDDVTRLSWSMRFCQKRLVIILRNFLYTQCALHSSFAPSLSIHAQARRLCAPTRSSPWSRDSRPPWPPRTCPGTPLQELFPLTFPCCPLSSSREDRSPRPARRPSASAASRTMSAARPASRSPAAAEPSSLNCSSWGWRRSFRSRSISPHQIG